MAILKIFFLTIALICLSFSGTAQIYVEDTESATAYVKNVLAGQGLIVGNITFTGKAGSLGKFETRSDLVGIKKGLVLSTGHISGISGPNMTKKNTTEAKLPKDRQSRFNFWKGDPDLDKLAKGKAMDVCILEFDFVPLKNKLVYNYIFTSEEYPEYAGSKYNDVFAMFLSGPGIEGKKNLALLKDGVTPVSINTVNSKINKGYYRSNNGRWARTGLRIRSFFHRLFSSRVWSPAEREGAGLMNFFQMDGFTSILKVRCHVIPYQKYHIKIALADGTDGKFDSAVLLEAGSFSCIQDEKGKYYDTLIELTQHPPDIAEVFGTNKPETETTENTIDKKFEISSLLFAYNSASLSDSNQLVLDQLTVYLLKNEWINCSIWGYTDNLGSEEYNKQLSEKRALAIKAYLVKKGVNESRFVHEGKSYNNPRYDNSNEEGRARNRRVEIQLE